MSLFLRIFLSFWLAAVLLAASFFVLGRYSGNQAIERHQAILQAQAEIVASIWIENGQRATMHWLFQQSAEQRPQLVNEMGQSPFKRHRPANPARGPGHGPIPINIPVSSGVERLQHGKVALVVALPSINPPHFLVKQLDPGQLHRLPMALWPLPALIIISLVSYMLATMLSRRIRELRRTVQVISAGDLTARVKLGGQDEVSALATDFNRMADRLNDILNSQRQLVSDVSHELRSPLARLRIALELAERAANPASALQRIAKEADELEQLVTDLLSLARIESGQFRLEKKTVTLCELLKRIVADAHYEGKASHRHVRLQSCSDTSIQADPVLLHSAIENVVRNALRYTPDESEVVVNLQLQHDVVCITIDDQGKGVPEQALARLFVPFARVAEARERDSGGFGLGLAITGRVIQAHGGQVSAMNRVQGGLRVSLTLPVSASDQPN
ncbi:MAG: HAMP domain-containing protein [Gammaproteobacteria bacterium]|nr:HAMP domain-containing protein [Gammaproteobacteria bacterium]